jgi:hypothetical protein
MAKSEGTNNGFSQSAMNDVDYLLAAVKNPNNPKGYKEAALGRIRAIEKKEGRVIYMNGSGDTNYCGMTCRNPSELARMEEEDIPGG